MVCKKCGSVLKGEWMFCPDCGERLLEETDLFTATPVEEPKTLEPEAIKDTYDKLAEAFFRENKVAPMDIEEFMHSKKMEGIKEEVSQAEKANHANRSKAFFFAAALSFVTAFILALCWLIPFYTEDYINNVVVLLSLIFIVLSVMVFIVSMAESHKAKANNIGKVFFLILNGALLCYSCIIFILDKYTDHREFITYEDITDLEFTDEELYMNKQDVWVNSAGGYETDYCSDYLFIFNKGDFNIGTDEFSKMLNELNEFGKTHSVNYIVMDKENGIIIHYDGYTSGFASNDSTLVYLSSDDYEIHNGKYFVFSPVSNSENLEKIIN